MKEGHQKVDGGKWRRGIQSKNIVQKWEAKVSASFGGEWPNEKVRREGGDGEFIRRKWTLPVWENGLKRDE
jgi:hypothetical protein